VSHRNVLFVIIGLLFLAILLSGLVSAEARRERHRRRLLEQGRHVTATVLAAEPTGHKRGGLSEMTIELELDDGRHALAHEAMTPAEQTRCRKGATVRAAVAEDDGPPNAALIRFG